ncbi:uncharacterized protein LOC129776013 [Toxorhynchites rutilus septentrionalis]|uniref:uncharacterized protein LOC129776013 n=1 Tax=Toxorhynchites rutilus septentrionalis TaxID=329112 RepID=UPI002478D578|nr:uncharacterized protein LOC129776013 [Toxorhynchites rutilus septentrionalis]
MEAVSSSTDKGLQQNSAVRRRQMRQKVLNRIRKVNIKNKGAKSFYYFTYEDEEVKAKDGSIASTYFFNGEPCEGDEQFLKQMKRSIFVSNIAAGTKKSEIKDLFYKFGKIGSIQLKAPNGKTIVGRQHISPYSPIVAMIKFTKKEEAEQACDLKDGKYQSKLVDQIDQYGIENCIRVDNIDPKVVKKELRDYFGAFGSIINISLETNDGSMVLTDNEYQHIRSVCCYVRFAHRSEAKAAKDMNEYVFKDRKLHVDLAYQKHCDPHKMSNNVLRMFFQNEGDVVALDQIPQQHMGYVCYKNALPADIIKRLNDVYRNKKIHLEKLDIGNIVKSQKQQRSAVEQGSLDTASSFAKEESSVQTIDPPSVATATKKTKMKTVQKKLGNPGVMTGPPGVMKKKIQRKAVSKSKAIEYAIKPLRDEFL